MQFVDATAGSGIDFTVGYTSAPVNLEYEVIAPSGVAAGDFDNDGDIDLFIVRGDIGPNLLYRNTGNLVFEEIASQAGLDYTRTSNDNYRHAGPMFVDMDGDGDLDLFIGGVSNDPALIFRNNGDSTFSDVTRGSGIDTMSPENTISVAFGDYDLDGDQDLMMAHWGTQRDFNNPGDTESLWRNDSDAAGIRFSNVTIAAGISPSIINLPDPLTTENTADFSFSPSFARINDDLYPDILIAADFNHSSVFINNQDGTFSNATDVDVIIDGNGMGSAVGDYDNDGDLDWLITSIEDTGDPFFADGRLSQIGNRLYRNVDGVFEDASNEANIRSGGWGWGACFLDLENDGDLDIYHTNGYPLADGEDDWENDTSRAFVSNGNGVFEEQATELGLYDTRQGRGIVCADFDDDGDIDILQLHRGTVNSATLWRNDTNGNNFLKVKLHGLPPNTEATGARVFVTIGAVTQMREISISSNYVSQNPTIQTIGLGVATQVDQLRIEWPDGVETIMNDVAAGQLLELYHPSL